MVLLLLWLCTSKIGFSKGMLFESGLSLLPKVALGVRSAFNYAGGVSLGFAVALSSRLRKLAYNNSRIWRKISSHFECSPYILNSIGYYPCLHIDRKENIPIAMRGDRKKSSNSFAIVLRRIEVTDIKGWSRCLECGGRQNTIMLRASHHSGRSIRSKTFALQRRTCGSFLGRSSME